MAYILRVRTIAKAVCASYMKHVCGIEVEDDAADSREEAGNE